jgi:hypothetical protein
MDASILGLQSALSLGDNAMGFFPKKPASTPTNQLNLQASQNCFSAAKFLQLIDSGPFPPFLFLSTRARLGSVHYNIFDSFPPSPHPESAYRRS